MATLDHGVLNVPGRTNTINAELDAYKAQQEASARTTARLAAAERAKLKARAKEQLAVHGVAIVARHGERFGAKELRHQLDQWAKWEPARLLAFVERFLAEQEAKGSTP